MSDALRPGAVRQRRHLVSGTSQAHPGVAGLDPISHRNVGFQPLPPPIGLAPYRYELASSFAEIAQRITHDGTMVFHVLGDSGGVKDAEFQSWVADQLAADLNGPSAPQFCYHVGDVVYFTGARDDYYAQFYEPYEHYAPPIFSIPGNHDGEVDDPSAQTSLDGWAAYFMQKTPDVDPISKDAPRVGLNLPNPYWTLVTPLATFVGLYTNVPEHGSIDSIQQQWFTHEIASADPDKALIVALHHPVYSFDVHHSGSARMADVLENAIRDTGRVPNLVLSGHVHDFQLIEKEIVPGTKTPFIVSGNGGYHNLHALHSDFGTQDEATGATLIAGNDKAWGYVTLTVARGPGQGELDISGHPTFIDRAGTVTRGAPFSYTGACLTLPAGQAVNL